MSFTLAFDRFVKVLVGQTLLSLCAVSVFFVVMPTPLWADGAAATDCQEVMVRIRAIRATGAFGAEVAESGGVSTNAVARQISAIKPEPVESALRDIASKLHKLRFKNFTLISSQQIAVPLMKKKTIFLNEGNSLTIRPLYVDGERIGLWLRWLDAAGTRVLDTRLHFQGGETMLTGTEGADDTGTVLAIEVMPGR